MLETLGRRIKLLRKQKGWSQRELCDAAGLSARFLVQLEGGKSNASVQRLMDIALALDVSLVTLFSGLGPVDDMQHRLYRRYEACTDATRNQIEALLGVGRGQKVALIGTDLPQMSSAYVRLAFKQLDKYPIVLGPTYDGGFGLIAARSLSPSIFKDVVWGKEDVLEKTLRNLRGSGSDYFLLTRILDVDTPEDYRRYQLLLNDI